MRPVFLKLIIVSISLAPCLEMPGQAATLLPLRQIKGLSQNTVFSILQDSLGFIWAATADGLNRFDGKAFDVYKPAITGASKGMTGHTIRYPLIAEQEGNFTFTTESGLHRYEARHNKVVGIPIVWSDTRFGANRPVAFHLGLTWMLGAFGALEAYNAAGKRIFVVPSPPFAGKQAALSTAFNSRYLFVAYDKVTALFDLNTLQWKIISVPSMIRHLACNEKELALVGDKEVYRLHISKNEIQNLNSNSFNAPASPWQACHIDQEGNIWLGDKAGQVFKCPAGDTTFRLIADINGSITSGSRSPVYCIFIDKTKNLWIGTDGQGILKADLKSSGFHTYPGRFNESHPGNFFVKSVCEDTLGNIWMGVMDEGLLCIENGSTQAKRIPITGFERSNEYLVRYIAEDERQNLLVGFEDKIAIRKKGQQHFTVVNLPKAINASIISENIISITPTGKEWLVITTWRTCRLVEKDNGRYAFITVTANSYDGVAMLNDSIALLGTSVGNLVQLNIRRIAEEPKLLQRNIFVLSIARNEMDTTSYWLSTKSGLVLYKPGNNSYRKYTEADGLINSFIYACLQKGNVLWISTNNGLTRVQLGEADKDGFPKISAYHFTSEDGLQGNEFNSFSFGKGKSGRFYFGGVDGLTWFHPDAIYQNAYLPVLVIKDIEVDNERIFSDSNASFITNIELPYNRRNLTVRLSALEFSNPSLNRYAWRMPGLQEDWVNMGNLPEIRIANLPYGHYTLEIKASNNSGLWMKKPLTISVFVRPPFWNKWWFFALMAMLVFAVTVTITRSIAQRRLKSRVAQLEYERSLENERQRIAREMHDDVGAGLTQIGFLSEGARRHASKQVPIDHELQRISDKVRDLVTSVSEMVWSLNKENNSLESLLVKMREQSAEQLEAAGIDFVAKLPAFIPSNTMSSQTTHNVLMVIKEAINNTIKHSGGSKLTMEIVINNQQLLISLHDNGKGLSTGSPTVGNGIRNMKHRIEEISGKLEMYNDNGLAIKIMIPISSIST